MLNTHTIILPFYFHAEIIEMNILFDITVVIPEDQCNHLRLLSSWKRHSFSCVFQIKEAQQEKAWRVLKVDNNTKLAAEDFRLK